MTIIEIYEKKHTGLSKAFMMAADNDHILN